MESPVEGHGYKQICCTGRGHSRSWGKSRRHGKPQQEDNTERKGKERKGKEAFYRHRA